MKKLLALCGVLFSLSAFAQSSLDDKDIVNYEYMPRINDVKLTGAIQQKFTAYKNGNPVNFIVVKKKNITVWDVHTFNSMKVGAKVSLEGLVPLRWTPDDGAPISTSREVVAKSVN